jgi:hypothetical protein
MLRDNSQGENCEQTIFITNLDPETGRVTPQRTPPLLTYDARRACCWACRGR